MQDKATKTVRLYADTHAQIERIHQSERIERAEIVRRAINAYIVVQELNASFPRPRLEVRA